MTPETIWVVTYHDERRGSVIAHPNEQFGRSLIAQGYKIEQYVRTVAQPFRRRPLTEAEAIAAREWSAHRPERDAGLFCDACFRDGNLEHCTGYYFDPETEDEGIVPETPLPPVVKYAGPCGRPLTQGGTDAFCTEPSGHDGVCVWAGVNL